MAASLPIGPEVQRSWLYPPAVKSRPCLPIWDRAEGPAYGPRSPVKARSVSVGVNGRGRGTAELLPATSDHSRLSEPTPVAAAASASVTCTLAQRIRSADG